ncbi:MAG: type II toxin-antitoxin system VapC family toxin [Anaerolineaceae bacterium]|nr:type II toxin-antitoxin system VapC family toxin [Anaerolineaceae bacterium]
MAATKVLDAYALMAYFEDEPGADLVRSLLLRAEEGGIKLAMSVVNLGEVWYAIARAESPEKADRIIQVIQGMAIELVDVDWNLTRQAAGFKARAKISYADCFTAALAKQRRAEIVTGDQEFNQLQNELKITWL